MELHEAIAKVHGALEGRYNLDGYDLHEIHGLLCEMQQSKKVCPFCKEEMQPKLVCKTKGCIYYLPM